MLDKTNRKYFENLDGLRTIAFLFVYLQHGFWGSFDFLKLRNSFLVRIVYNVFTGATGVSIFFVLSGFLITYLLLEEIDLRGKINVRYFYIRRILRIWPLYYAAILFIFGIYPNVKHFMGLHNAGSNRPAFFFFFISNFDVIHVQKFFYGHDSLSGNVTWSLAVEEQFYLIWPLLFFYLPKRFYKWIFVFVIVTCLAFRYLNRTDHIVLYFHSLSVCGDLAVGGLAAYLAFYNHKYIQWICNLPKSIIWCIYILGFSWLLYGDILLARIKVDAFYRVGCTIFFAFIVLEQNFGKNSFYKFHRSKILSYCGKYTYGLYLLHPIAILSIDILLRMFHFHYNEGFLPLFVTGIAGLCMTSLLAYISYEYFESRFLKLKSKFNYRMAGQLKYRKGLNTNISHRELHTLE